VISRILISGFAISGVIKIRFYGKYRTAPIVVYNSFYWFISEALAEELSELAIHANGSGS
jgi:hypothetical protein